MTQPPSSSQSALPPTNVYYVAAALSLYQGEIRYDARSTGRRPEVKYGTGEHLGEDPDNGVEPLSMKLSTYGCIVLADNVAWYRSWSWAEGLELGQRVSVTLAVQRFCSSLGDLLIKQPHWASEWL
ncbi:hypothetical protein WG66_008727 [Moniliophthora roreri]|nr:hypothetical protein WG66_008727 [Moniliophthora roreri]